MEDVNPVLDLMIALEGSQDLSPDQEALIRRLLRGGIKALDPAEALRFHYALEELTKWRPGRLLDILAVKT